MTDGDRGRSPHRRLGEAVGQLREWRGRWYATPAVLAVTFLGLAVFPLVLDVGAFGVRLGAILSVHILVVALIWAVAAQGWNVVSGFAGQFSFGHAAFFGLGAYAPLVLASEFAISPWIGLVVGSVVAGLYALGIGLLSFRYDIRGSYFALVTLAFAELLLYLFVNVDQVGGASGYVKPLPRTYATDFGLAAFQFREALPYYYVVLAFLVVITLVAFAVKRSRVGLYLHAIRDDETAAAAVGIPTVRYKLFALVLSAMCTAWAGTAWSMYFTSIRPRVVFGVLVNLDILLPAVVGGIGTVVGPIVGSVVLTAVGEFARQSVGVPELQHVVYGVLLLVIVLHSPGGIVSWTGTVADRLRGPVEYVRPNESGDD